MYSCASVSPPHLLCCPSARFCIWYPHLACDLQQGRRPPPRRRRNGCPWGAGDDSETCEGPHGGRASLAHSLQDSAADVRAPPSGSRSIPLRRCCWNGRHSSEQQRPSGIDVAGAWTEPPQQAVGRGRPRPGRNDWPHELFYNARTLRCCCVCADGGDGEACSRAAALDGVSVIARWRGRGRRGAQRGARIRAANEAAARRRSRFRDRRAACRTRWRAGAGRRPTDRATLRGTAARIAHRRRR
jgi:hypothetical protein